MGINHGGPKITVSKQFLDGSDVIKHEHTRGSLFKVLPMYFPYHFKLPVNLRHDRYRQMHGPILFPLAVMNS